MKTDSVFYRLQQSEPTLVFELAGIVVAETSGYQFRSQEIKQTSFRLDGVIEPPPERPDAPRAYVEVEVQFQPDDDFYIRFFREILLHLGQYPTAHPWYAVVIYPNQTVERVATSMEPLLELPNLSRVYLDRRPLLDSANPKIWLIGLVIADFDKIAPIADKIKGHHAKQATDSIDWMDLLETVLVYKLPKFNREEIKKMLNFEDVELKQTRFYQDVFAEGLAEGQIIGEARGETRGEATMFLKLLERKFHTVPESARKRIEAADAETLLLWGERVLDATGLDEIWGH